MQNYFDGTPGLILTEDDVRRFILREQKYHIINTKLWSRAYKAIINVVVMFVVLYVLLNLPSLYLQSKFYFQENAPQRFQSTPSYVNLPIPGQIPQQANSTTNQPQFQDNHIYIPSIGVDAPINWDVPGDNSTVLKSLQTGVAQLQGTAKPGEAGNVFIVGHSSGLPFTPGNYKQVFAVLNQVKQGDIITVVYHNIPYQYRVTETRVVKPDDTSVLDQTSDPQLSIMTCTPTGTNLRRLIKIAKPLNPELHTALPETRPTTGQTLPGSL